jgi:hypothetical protein
VPRDLADVHHRGAAVDRVQFMTHVCHLLVSEWAPRRGATHSGLTRRYPCDGFVTPIEEETSRSGWAGICLRADELFSPARKNSVSV